MGSKAFPEKFDCYEADEVDEPMFVLLARDEKAPAVVRAWVLERKRQKTIAAKLLAITTGKLVAEEPDAKELEALACADAMEAWRKENEGRLLNAAERRRKVTPRKMLALLLLRIGSWTNARYDQHLRFEFGDENAEKFLRWLKSAIGVDVAAEGSKRASEQDWKE